MTALGTVAALIILAACAAVWWDLHRSINAGPTEGTAADLRQDAADARELAAGIHTVPGGVRAGCITPDCLRAAELPHPDGGAGGVCTHCWMELT